MTHGYNQPPNSNSNPKKLSPFTRELTTLDSQIDRTEAEIQRIRMNIESLQTQFRENKGGDIKPLIGKLSGHRGYKTAGAYSNW
jgi:peptidoglycan hydrolase CwlO-like protein